MLKMTSTSINGSCQINGTDVVYFSATFSQGVAENISVSKNIINTSVYKDNRSTCEADYLEFEVQAERIASRMESSTGNPDQEGTAGRDQENVKAPGQSGTGDSAGKEESGQPGTEEQVPGSAEDLKQDETGNRGGAEDPDQSGITGEGVGK